MPKDGLTALPDDIVAPLLRALVTIRPAPEARLYLVRTEHGRPPDWDAINDYNVLYRDRPVGRIWRAIYQDSEWRDCPWHWSINLPGESDIAWGHSMTLVEAMQDFRRAWDAHVYKTAMNRACE